MDKKEYIELRNLVKIYELCGLLKKLETAHDAMWIGKSLYLLKVLCELEDQDKYPTTTDLNELITFYQENPSSVSLKFYLERTPGFDLKFGLNQMQGAYIQHEYIAMTLETLRDLHNRNYSKLCTLDLEKKYRLKNDLGNFYLEVVTNDTTLNIERLGNDPEKTFRVNGVIMNDLELFDVINIITYEQDVKAISKHNIQTAYQFLR